MALSSYALIDLSYFNTQSGLGIVTGTSDETKLFAIINAVTDIFEKICGRHLDERTYSYLSASENYNPEYAIFDAPPKTTFWFPTYPVSTLTTFIISDTTVTEATDYDDSDGYTLYKHTGKLVYEYGFDYNYMKNIKTVWTGGYNSGHQEYADLQYLTYLVVKKIWDSPPNEDEILSETIGNYRFSRSSVKELSGKFGLPTFVFEQIFKFKRFAFA